MSSSTENQVEAATTYRKLLSIERDPPIDRVLETGIAPRLLELCQQNEAPRLQFEMLGWDFDRQRPCRKDVVGDLQYRLGHERSDRRHGRLGSRIRRHKHLKGPSEPRFRCRGARRSHKSYKFSSHCGAVFAICSVLYVGQVKDVSCLRPLNLSYCKSLSVVNDLSLKREAFGCWAISPVIKLAIGTSASMRGPCQ